MWSNQQDSPVLVRLDRALANMAWAQKLPDSSLSSVTRTTSDHVSLCLTALSSIPKSSIFRLDRSLLNVSQFKEKVTNWNSVGFNHAHLGSVGSLALKIKHTRNMAKIWTSNRRSPKMLVLNCHATINFLDKLEEVRSLSNLELQLRIAVKLSLHRLNGATAAHWGERAKIKDCVLGDENSSYMHVCATVRHRKNQMKSLSNNSISYFAHADKEAILLNFFKNLVGSRSAANFSFALAPICYQNSLTSDQAGDLLKPFTLKEIKNALWAMNDNASPGPDGLGPAFYKANWDLVKLDLLNLLSDFHSGVADLKLSIKL